MAEGVRRSEAREVTADGTHSTSPEAKYLYWVFIYGFVMFRSVKQTTLIVTTVK
jgi:hypothetical protein